MADYIFHISLPIDYPKIYNIRFELKIQHLSDNVKESFSRLDFQMARWISFLDRFTPWHLMCCLHTGFPSSLTIENRKPFATNSFVTEKRQYNPMIYILMIIPGVPAARMASHILDFPLLDCFLIFTLKTPCFPCVPSAPCSVNWCVGAAHISIWWRAKDS